MKTFAFVRSRTYYREFDYRLLTPISSLPKDVHTHFSKCVSNLMRDSASDWEVPTWLLIKRDCYLLWGVAISNRIFSEDCYQEEVGRRGVRCFCGVVISNYDSLTIQLPYDIQAFQPVFDQTIGKIWMDRIYELPDTLVELGKVDVYIKPMELDTILNNNPHICHLFPSNTDSLTLLSAALACSNDMSIAVNVKDSSQVCDTKYAQPLLNAIMRDNMSTIDISVKYKCEHCGKIVSEIKDGLCIDCLPQDEPFVIPKNEDDEIRIDPICTCQKCHQIVDYVNEKGICVRCNRKIKQQKIFIWLSIGILIIYSLGFYISRIKKQPIDCVIHIENIDEPHDTISRTQKIID